MTSYLERTINDRFTTLSAYHDAASVAIGKQVGENPIVASAGPDGSFLSYSTRVSQHTEQYKHNRGWVYVGVRVIAHRLAGQKLMIGRRISQNSLRRAAGMMPKVLEPWQKLRLPGYVKSISDDIEVLENHPFLDAMANPNEVMTAWSLMYHWASSIEITGKAYWWMPVIKGKLQIWPLPSDWVTPIHTQQQLFHHYDIVPPGASRSIPVPSEEIAYFPLPDPSNPLTSLSPVQTQDAAIAADEAIQTAQWRSYKNGYFPGIMIRVGNLPGVLPGEEGEVPVLEGFQRQELISAVRSIVGGAVNHDEPLIVDGLIKDVQKFTNAPREMDYLKSGQVTKSRIFQSLGVNPIIVGEITGVNRAQAAVADALFVSSVICPLAIFLGQVLTKKINDPSLVVWIDTPTASDDELRAKQWETALVNSVVSQDEYRANQLGLPPKEDGSGKEGVPQKPTGQSGGEKPPAKPTSDDEDEDGESKAVSVKFQPTGRHRQFILGLWAKQTDTAEAEMVRAMSAFFDSQIKSVQKELRRVYDESPSLFGTPDAAEAITQSIFRPRDWDAPLKQAAVVPVLKAVVQGYFAEKALLAQRYPALGKAWAARTGQQLKAADPNIVAQSWLLNWSLPQNVRGEIGDYLTESLSQPWWNKINDTTRRDIATAVARSIDARQNLDLMAENVKHAIGGKVKDSRAMNIARTEQIGALNAGHVIQGKELEAEGMRVLKYWIHSADPKVRQSHRHMGQPPQSPVDGADGLFNVEGVKVPFPGHFLLPPENRCNCILPGQLVQGSFIAGTKSWYEGKSVEVVLRSGRRFSVTPQHSVATENGFVPACEIQEGDKVLSYDGQVKSESSFTTGSNKIYHEPLPIEEVFESLRFCADMTNLYVVERVRPLQTDFHGDGCCLKGQVDVVRPNIELVNCVDSSASEIFLNSYFRRSNTGLIDVSSKGHPLSPLLNSIVAVNGRGVRRSGGGFPRGTTLPFNSRPVLFDGFPLQEFRIGPAAYWDVSFSESVKQNRTAGSEFIGKTLKRFSSEIPCDETINVDLYPSGHSDFCRGSQSDSSTNKMCSQGSATDSCLAPQFGNSLSSQVFLDEVIEVRYFDFCGHVYDLQSLSGIIVTNGACLSNCRCIVATDIASSAPNQLEDEVMAGEPEQAVAEIEGIEDAAPAAIETADEFGFPTEESIDSAKTIDGLQEAAHSLNISEIGTQSFKGVSQTQAALGLAKDGLKTIAECQRRCPLLMEQLRSPDFPLTSVVYQNTKSVAQSGIWKASKNSNGSYAYQNTKSLDGRQCIARIATKGMPSTDDTLAVGGKFNASWSIQNSIRHEYGHHVQRVIGSTTPAAIAEWNSIYKAMGREQVSKKVSGYAAYDSDEMFAECYSIWTHEKYAESTKKLPKEVEAYFEKYLGKREELP